MKSLVISLLVLGSISVFSGDYDKLVCQRYNYQSGKVLQSTIVLEKTGKALEGYHKVPELQYEAEKIPYRLTFYKNGPESFNGVDYEGYVYTEDVDFFFTTDNGKVSFRLYLDEMNEGTFSKARMKTQNYFCY